MRYASVLPSALLLLVFGCTEPGGAPGATPGAPARIVSMAPNLTEICFALGAGDRVVGVTEHCNHPEAAGALPKVGGYNSPSLEAILGLEPDLVLCAEEGPLRAVVERLETLGISVWTVRIATLADLFRALDSIGKRVGAARAAAALRGDLEARRDRVRDRVASKGRVPVVVVFDRAPLVVAGPGTFADDLIRLAGGTNVAADATSAYPQLAMESLLAREPEVIVDLAAMGTNAGGAKEWWARWEGLPAVRNGRVSVGDPDLLTRPGPRLLDGLEWLAGVLHPE